MPASSGLRAMRSFIPGTPDGDIQAVVAGSPRLASTAELMAARNIIRLCLLHLLIFTTEIAEGHGGKQYCASREAPSHWTLPMGRPGRYLPETFVNSVDSSRSPWLKMRNQTRPSLIPIGKSARPCRYGQVKSWQSAILPHKAVDGRDRPGHDTKGTDRAGQWRRLLCHDEPATRAAMSPPPPAIMCPPTRTAGRCRWCSRTAVPRSIRA
jgi:hypothetical protein